MEPRDIVLDTADGMSLLGSCWKREGEKPRAAVLLLHGMAEHIARYGHFASFLAEKSFAVYGFDIRGHGRTGDASGRMGTFAPENGWNKCVEDTDLWVERMRLDLPEAPIVIFGHSMGALLARSYTSRFGEKLSALILSGVAGDPGLLGKAARWIAWIEASVNGTDVPSHILDRLVFKRYAGSVRRRRTDFDWLSRDEQVVDAYNADPDCGNVMSAGLYRDLFAGVKEIHKPSSIRRTPVGLPIYIFSGSRDPVGGFTRGVSSVYKEFRKAGVQNITIKFYSEARHEMLNETNREEVYRDVLTWLNSRFPVPASGPAETES